MTRWLRRAVSRPAAPGWALALLMIAVVTPLVPIVTAQPAVRAAQSAALVEHRSVHLDAYRRTVQVDHVAYDGHILSDKAPLQAWAASPVYAVGRALGMESATVPRERGNLTVWWLTLWSAVLPAAGLIVLMHRVVRGLVPGAATFAVGAIGFGTLLLPFAGQLYGHVLCTLMGFGAWAVIRRRPVSAKRGAVAGALVGAAVATEYPMALLAVVLGGILVWDRAWRPLAAFVAGGVPFALLVGAYHQVALGSPFTSPYSLKSVHVEAGPTVTGLPSPARAVEVLIGSRGLLLFSPVVALGLVGLVMLVRRGGEARRHGVAGLATFGSFWLLQAGWSNPWGGEMPGPRYMIAALPFLAVGVAEIAPRVPALARVAVGWSVIAMTMPLLTLHLVPDGGRTVLSHIENLDDFGVTPTIFHPVLGGWGWIVWLAGILAAGCLMVEVAKLSSPADRANDRGRPVTPRAAPDASVPIDALPGRGPNANAGVS